jgi:hypothetical protein
VDGPTIFKAAFVQAAGVALLSLLLVVITPGGFFREWGFVAGPAAWLVCAAATAAILALPVTPVLAGAVLAGVPSALATILGLHWLGAILAILLFALWCGRVRRDPRITDEVI